MSFGRYFLRRVAAALLLIFIAASAALLLTIAGLGCQRRRTGQGSGDAGSNPRSSSDWIDPSSRSIWPGCAARPAWISDGRFCTARPVNDLLRERAVNTAVLASAVLLAATALGIPLGVYTGLRERGVGAQAVRVISLFLVSTPPLVFSLALVTLAGRTGWLPVGGMTSPGSAAQAFSTQWIADVARHLLLPTLALALPLAAVLERLQSQALASSARHVFVRAALARGLSPDQARLKHAWRGSLGAVLGLYGVIIGTLFSGSFVVELVAAWPGLGRLMYDALLARDLFLVAGARGRRRHLSRGRHPAVGSPAGGRRSARPRKGPDLMRRVAWLVAGLFAAALAAPWLAPHDPERHYSEFQFAPPMRPRVIHGGSLHAPFVRPIELADRLAQRYSEDLSRTRPLPWFGGAPDEPVFLLGADSFGRDQLSRLLYGARVSLSLALTSVLGVLVLGALIGALAGYRGGWVDDALMRTADFFVVLPIIYVALVLRAVLPLVLDPRTVFILLAGIFTLVGWPFVARGVRGVVASEREQEYVVAAQSIGAGTWRIIGRHLLPACAELPRRAGDLAAAGVRPRGSDAVVRRAGISGTNCHLGHDAARGRDGVGADALSVDAGAGGRDLCGRPRGECGDTVG